MFNLENPEWSRVTSDLLQRVHRELGVDENTTISAELYKLLLYL